MAAPFHAANENRTMNETTSIVVGGGLAGAAFAIELARRGDPVTVLEKTSGPHHKVCGEFLSAEAQDLLAKLGLDIRQLGASRATHLSLECGRHLTRFALPFRGAGLSRFRLDQALLDVAERSGAQIIRGATVTKLEHSGPSVVVHTATARWRANHVALATGKHNLRGLPRPQAPTVAFKMQLRPAAAATAELTDLVHLSMFPGGYAGACLVEDGIATICWVVARDLLDDTSAGWDAHAEFLAKRSHFFAALLDGAMPLWDKPVAIAAIPYGFLREDVISNAIYPLGDQLVVIPSYTGGGTSIALHTGATAAQAVLNGRSAAEFQASAIAKLKPQIAWAKLANVAFVNAAAQRATAAVARLAPWALPQVATFIVNMTRLRT
jgi:flavin-dependent dehydrogenase